MAERLGSGLQNLLPRFESASDLKLLRLSLSRYNDSLFSFQEVSIYMKREFLLNILFLLSINLLIKPFYIFGIDRTVQNRVGLEDYGLYATLFSFTFLLQIINDFGLQNFNNRNIAQHHQLLPKYFPNMLLLKLGLGIIYGTGEWFSLDSIFPYGTALVAAYQVVSVLVVAWFVLKEMKEEQVLMAG